jgi:hypothetical protein
MVLDLLANPLGGYDRLLALVARSHGSDIHKRQLKKKAAQLFRALRRAELVVVARRDGRRGSRVSVAADLQRDFSLHHTLGIWLIEALHQLEALAPEGREGPTFAGDVLSLVESILENPQPVLFAQVDKRKGEAVAEMKAAGVEYEERMERLEEVEHEKPLADFIYESFNTFALHHPWVGKENVRPKSVARELVEKFASFPEYVRFYGLQRTEGILLRYLSDALRTTQKSVPIETRNDALWDLIEQLRLEVRSIDSSLLDEWEGRRDGRTIPAAARKIVSAEPPWDDRRVAARLRSELVRLLGALSRKQWDEALETLATRDEDPAHGTPAWTAQALDGALQPLYAAHGAISFNPAARTPQHTTLRKLSDHLWEAQQRIITPDLPDEECAWAIVAVFDLSSTPGDLPLLRLRAIHG